MCSIVTALAVIAMACVGTSPVYAAEATDEFSTNNSIAESNANTQEVQKLRSEIDALIAQESSSRESYKTDYWGEVTFTNTNVGAYHTIYGHKARMAIAFKPVDGNSALSASLSTSFWSWTLHYSPNHVDADGYYMYVGPWKDITYQGVYNMTYRIFTTGNGGVLDGRRASFHVWVDYQ